MLDVQHKAILDKGVKRVIQPVAQSLNELPKVPGPHLSLRQESLKRWGNCI